MRERLTGAVILVAALAILVPEMLSGPGDEARPVDAADAPAEAGPPLTTYDVAIDPEAAAPPHGRTELGVRDDPRELAEAVPPPVTEPSPLGVAGTQDAAGAPQQELRADATAAQAADDAGAPPVAASRPVPAPAPASANPPRPAPPAGQSARPAPAAPAAARAAVAPGERWWVQLGSFSSEPNAQGLARKLREAGFSIEVSKVRSNGRDLHRVRAGPVAGREAAVTLRSRLAAAGQPGTLVAP